MVSDMLIDATELHEKDQQTEDQAQKADATREKLRHLLKEKSLITD